MSFPRMLKLALAMGAAAWISGVSWQVEADEGGDPDKATRFAPFVNSLWMKFVPVLGSNVLFSVWDTRVQDYAAFATEQGITPAKSGFDQSPKDPAVMVSFLDAQAFCAWLSKKEGLSYRLPTDAEWSAMAGLEAEKGATVEEREKSSPREVYPWGRQWPPPKDAGNYAPSLHVDTFPKTSPVGSFEPNPGGIFDVGGNVWQWCADWQNTSARQRVLRGASWSDKSSDKLRSAARRYAAPNQRFADAGFRCVLERSKSMPDARKAMVIVDRGNGVKPGSDYGVGFLLRMEGKVYIVTEPGALLSKHGVKYKTADGRELSPGPFQMAQNNDIARAEVPDEATALEMVPNVGQRLEPGEGIFIMGYDERPPVTWVSMVGGMKPIALKDWHGVREEPVTVTDLSLDRIGLKAAFGWRCNGAPIFAQPMSRVVGVAHYVMAPPMFQDHPTPHFSGLPQLKTSSPVRFAYRLDGVKGWVIPPPSNSVMDQERKLVQFENATVSIARLLSIDLPRMSADFAVGFLDLKDGDPGLVALHNTIEERKPFGAALYPVLREFLTGQVRDFKQMEFSGYLAIRLREELQQRDLVIEWLDALASRNP